MPPERLARLAAAALLAMTALLLAACGQTSTPDDAGGPAPSQQHAKAAMGRVAAQANQLIDASPKDVRARLNDLRGRPVVVNQWASWCGPCRAEFPFFQQLATRYRGRVAFLGVDSQDSRDDAKAFLKQFPVPYPNYYDEDASIARSLGAGRGWPTTLFYRASGKLEYIHVGAYASEPKLEADIKRYALGG